MFVAASDLCLLPSRYTLLGNWSTTTLSPHLASTLAQGHLPVMAVGLLPLLATLLSTLLPLVYSADAGHLLKEGDAAFARGEYQNAIRSYTAAIELDPTTALLYTKRAAAHISLRQHAQALNDLDKALDLDNNFTQGYLHRGKLHR